MKSSHFPSLNISKPGCNSHKPTLSKHKHNRHASSSVSISAFISNSNINPNLTNLTNSTPYSPAFTIVELLIVIVVIGILAAITIVSYTGVTARANTATIQADLASASKQLSVFNVTNDHYPLTNNCSVAESSTNICLKLSPKYVYTYAPNNSTNPTDYTLSTETNNSGYNVSSKTTVSTIANLAQPTDCPSGFIPVPGSPTYGTSGFCIMKYEAKIYGNDVGTTGYSLTNLPSSRASGTPYVNISQTNAITQATKTVNQSGTTIANAHLTTEAEWLTVAQNVLSVASNWSGGAVGSGYIYRGHSDNAPANSLAASTDTDGYSGTGNSTSSSPEQKRTLTLSNGQVIWDMAGNVWDWTAGQTSGVNNQPGITGAGYAWRNWRDMTNPGNLTSNPSPAATGISGSNTWTVTNGVGAIYNNSDEANLRGFIRGGNWNGWGNAGVLCLNLLFGPSFTGADIGFRVSR